MYGLSAMLARYVTGAMLLRALPTFFCKRPPSTMKSQPCHAALQGWFNDEVEARNALANLPVVQEKLKVDRSEVIWGRPPGANWFERGVGETPNINWLV